MDQIVCDHLKLDVPEADMTVVCYELISHEQQKPVIALVGKYVNYQMHTSCCRSSDTLVMQRRKSSWSGQCEWCHNWKCCWIAERCRYYCRVARHRGTEERLRLFNILGKWCANAWNLPWYAVDLCWLPPCVGFDDANSSRLNQIRNICYRFDAIRLMWKWEDASFRIIRLSWNAFQSSRLSNQEVVQRVTKCHYILTMNSSTIWYWFCMSLDNQPLRKLKFQKINFVKHQYTVSSRPNRMRLYTAFIT